MIGRVSTSVKATPLGQHGRVYPSQVVLYLNLGVLQSLASLEQAAEYPDWVSSSQRVHR